MKSIKKNYMYNLLYQILITVAPLVTTPYVSRVLGAEPIGEYSFSYSIVYYFMLVAVLGTSTYAEREMSFYQDDRGKRSLRFWDLTALRVITTFISMVCYAVIVRYLFTDYTMFCIISLNLMAVALDTVWLFQGLEEFGQITLRDTIVKVATIIMILLFVNSPRDLYVYVLIMSLSPVISAVALIPFVHRYIDKPSLKNLHPFKDFKSILGLFIPTVAISIYAMLDKTMIGIFTITKAENGYYEQAMKLSKTALTIVTSLGTVMIPRISYYAGKKQTKKIEEYMLKSYQFVWMLGIPICFGLIGISNNLVPWFYGTGFEKVKELLCILSFLVIAIGLSNVTGLQYLVPTKQQNKLTHSVLMGAAVNVILNAVLIPRFYAFGAAVASVFAEFTVTIVQFAQIRKQMNIRKILFPFFRYAAAGAAMLVLLILEDKIFSPNALCTCAMIASGGGMYFLILLLYKDSLVYSALASVKEKFAK